MTRRILLVDDDDAIRLVARLALERVGGHEVVAVPDGESALTAVVDGRFDVVLLDVMMPGLDGPSTLQRLRGLPQATEVPVVFLTASVRSDEVARLEQLGVAGVLGKPFDPATLATELGAVLGWQDPAETAEGTEVGTSDEPIGDPAREG